MSQERPATMHPHRADKTGGPRTNPTVDLPSQPAAPDVLSGTTVLPAAADPATGSFPELASGLVWSFPQRVGDFEVLGEIGHVGGAVAFKAWHTTLSRMVALNVIPDQQGNERTTLELLKHEAQATAALNHPNIVRIFAAGTDNGVHFYATTLVEGPTLAELVAKEGPLPVQRAVSILLGLCDAMAYAHTMGILHQDLKPENVKIDAVTGRPCLSGFTLAKRDRALTVAPTDDESMQGLVLDAPSFMPPELAQGHLATPVSDLYSLGGILYFALTGRPPFSGDNHVATLIHVVQHTPDSLRATNPNIPPELEAICLKCLEKNPANRYRTVAALGEDLNQFYERAYGPMPTGIHSRVTDIVPPPRPAPQRWRFPLLAASAIFFGVVVGIGALWLAGIFRPASKGGATGGDSGAGQASEQSDKKTVPEQLRTEFALRVTLNDMEAPTGEPKPLPAGEQVVIKIQVEKDAYVQIWSIHADGSSVRLFPNKHETNDLVKANEPRIVPGVARYQFTAKPAADSELIYVAALTKQWPTVQGEELGAFLLCRNAINQSGALEKVRAIVPEEVAPAHQMSELTLKYRVHPKPTPEQGSYLPVPLFLWPSVAALAQSPDQEAAALSAVQDALVKYRAGELQAAERLYRKAQVSSKPDLQRECFDRLLEIYVRLARHDQAVRTAVSYKEWLTNRKETNRLAELDLQLGRSYLALGHLKRADRHLEDAILARPALLPFQTVAALADRARCAEQRGDPTRAGKFWAEVKTEALRLLELSEQALPTEQRFECVWQLSDAYRFQKKPREGIAQLEALVKRFDALRDWQLRRDTLRRLAAHLTVEKDFRAAERVLRDALAAHERYDKLDLLTRGDLLYELSETLAGQAKQADATKAREEAIKDYRATMKDSEAQSIQAAEGYWRLQRLYLATRDYKKALEFSVSESEKWAQDALVLPRLQTEQGILHLALSDYDAARKVLESAVAALLKQEPVNLIELPRVLNCLARVEQEAGRLDRADELGAKCLRLYADNDVPDDVNVVETYTILGTVSSTRGNNAQAMEQYRLGNLRAEKLVKLGKGGNRPIQQQCGLQLNIALIHRAQGEYKEALELCKEAQALYKQLGETDPQGDLSFHAALATLYLSLGEFQNSVKEATALKALCDKLNIKTGQLVFTHMQCRAIGHTVAKEYDAAQQLWLEMLALQKAAKVAFLIPRTLNYLGFNAYRQGKMDAAEKYFQEACDLQKDNPTANVAHYYTSLWRLARVKFQQKKDDQARALLQRALEIVDVAREQVYGDSKQRAAFFASFEGAVEDLVDALIRAKMIEQACVIAARGRSRTLLDQFQLAGVNPRDHLSGERGQQLKKEEAELLQKITTLQARAQQIPLEDTGKPETVKLATELDQARADYAKVWREVLNASPVYRELTATQDVKESLVTIRKNALTTKTWLLLYWIGRERSYAFLIGPEKTEPEVFPLQAPADAVARLAAIEPKVLAQLGGGRGIEITPITKPAEGVKSVTMTRSVAAIVVNSYMRTIKTTDFKADRGIEIEEKEKAPALAVEVPANLFLPEELRQRLKALNLEQLIVVPDGSLHQLPLEVLVLKGGVKPVYGMDELPPLVYAPSVAGLAHLLNPKRKPKARSDRPTLLTVGNVDYPRDPDKELPKDITQLKTLQEMRAQLERLKFSKQESEGIQRLFGADRYTAFAEQNATENAIVKAMTKSAVIHLAVHGFADETKGNLFGALALSLPDPKSVPTPDNDGLLCLHEIYQLPLENCELAVLSACVTNVGPQAPLEPAVTIANGFLSAGARRVVGSHWYVNDESTAQLMEAFFKELLRKGDAPVSHAEALQRARRAVRGDKDHPKWESPRYWGPFVLLGTGQ